MEIWLRRLLKALAITVLAVGAVIAVLCFPVGFFAHTVRADNLILRSDRPLPEQPARDVLRLSGEKLRRSPLFKPDADFTVHVCNSRWRQRLFFNYNYGVGGVAYPFTTNVFLRDSDVGNNRLISPSGKPVPGIRTLDFFVTHELMHALTARSTGASRYLQLPEWIREGYADYVAWGSVFPYEESRRALLAEEKDMDPARSGLYLRYALLVAHQLERKGISVEQLLKAPFPEQLQVEAELRQVPVEAPSR